MYYWSGKLPIIHFVFGRDRRTVRPPHSPYYAVIRSSVCLPFFLYFFISPPYIVFSYCAVNTDIEQQTIFFFFFSFIICFIVDKDNLLLPLHQNDDRSCFVYVTLGYEVTECYKTSHNLWSSINILYYEAHYT